MNDLLLRRLEVVVQAGDLQGSRHGHKSVTRADESRITCVINVSGV